ncbi:recombinase family protein [Microbacterium sp. P05]|uniref:recombinase family protein n=1 Tax=Microbacterium sp. P05 TaxID=3366948 RepID=UPI0037474727
MRPGLDDLLSRVRPGDSITVHSFDRLGRTALHGFQTLAELKDKGVTVYSMKGTEQQFSGATGKFLRDVLILVAELERSMNQEREAEARAAKAARAEAGEQVAGRPITTMTTKNIRKVRHLKGKGRTVAEIVKLTGISRALVHRALADA